jgi:hypothetical protein
LSAIFRPVAVDSNGAIVVYDVGPLTIVGAPT